MAGPDNSLRIGTALAVSLACLVGMAGRLPDLGSRSLGSEEQIAFVESQGLDPFKPIEEGDPVTAAGLRRPVGPWSAAREARVAPLHAGLLAVWSGVAGRTETDLRLASALAGVLAVGLVAWIGVRLGGAPVGAAGGLLVALSPLHALASREAVSSAMWMAVLVLSLSLLLLVERSGRFRPAVCLGVAGGLLLSGPGAVAAVGVLQLGWLAWRRDRRPAAVTAMGSAAVVVAVAALLGLLRSPLSEGAHLDWVPATTLAGLVRCTGASFTRVLGLEYHQIVPQARSAAPLTVLAVALLVLGARQMEPRFRGLVLGGVILPFAVGAALAIVTGRVTPLQAPRMLPAVPFVALAVGGGLASLRGWRAAVASVVVLGSAGGLLVLALLAPPAEVSPTAALVRQIAECRPPAAVTEIERPLDLLALAAWDLPGPLVLRPAPGSTRSGPTIRVASGSACARGLGSACSTLSDCTSP